MKQGVLRRHLVVALAVVTLAQLPLSLSHASAANLANFYLVAIGDNGQSGQAVGCGDSLIPVQTDVGNQPTTEAKISAALSKLFAIHSQYYGESGLYDALYQSNLTVTSVHIEGSRAVVHIDGTLQLGGVCDDPRALGQIDATVKQFTGIDRSDVVYHGDLLSLTLNGRGEHPNFRYFPETDHLVGNGFLKYWQNFGGLATFGYPISEEMTENGTTVQYFQRARFEWHPGAAPQRYDVLLGLLGTIVAQQQGLQGTPPFQPMTASSDANCSYYAATGHRLCFGFRDYWNAHGGLATFGYPISEEFQQNGVTVQYFQRQRFEYHPQNSPEWRIEGGLLGTQVYQMNY